jgi:hypothetical protein
MPKYRANHNVLMPDGKSEVKAGEIFEYNGDIYGFEEVVVQVADDETASVVVPDPEYIIRPDTEAAKSDEKEIREKAKALGIKSAHNKSIDKLKEEIAVIEAENAADNGDADDEKAADNA